MLKNLSPESKLSAIVLAIIVLMSSWMIFQEYKKYQAFSATQTPSRNMQDLKKVISPNAIFYTKILSAPSDIHVTIPYRTESTQPITLTLAGKSGFPSTIILVDHPTLKDLDWPYVEAENGIRLYQKNTVYESIDAFTKNPPAADEILADKPLLDYGTYQNLKAKPLTDESVSYNRDDFNFILTTFHPPIKEGEYYFFERNLNATNALINDQNEMVWQITASQASQENPYYLGEINIQYQ